LFIISLSKLFCVPLILTHSLFFSTTLYFYLTLSQSLLSKVFYTLDIFAHNIAIKRYFDKNIILSHGCLKAKESFKQKLAQGTLRFFCAYLSFVKACLGWHRNLWLKIDKLLHCLFIFLSQYCMKKYLVCIKPLHTLFFFLPSWNVRERVSEVVLSLFCKPSSHFKLQPRILQTLSTSSSSSLSRTPTHTYTHIYPHKEKSKISINKDIVFI